MTTTPAANQVGHILSGTHEVVSSDRSIDLLPSELQDWTERNVVQFEQTCPGDVVDVSLKESDEAPPVSSSVDIAVLLPVPAAALEAAAARLRHDPAIQKALKRLLEGGWSYRDDDASTITFEPRSRGRNGKGARSYTTTAQSCTCPGAVIRGDCYHLVAWMIINEARTPTMSLQCTLPSAMFVHLALLVLACGTELVTLCVDSGSGTLTLRSSTKATATIHVDMATSVLLVIEQHIHTADLKRVTDGLVDALPPEGDQLLLEVDATTLMIVAGTEDMPTLVDGLSLLLLDASTAPLA